MPKRLDMQGGYRQAGGDNSPSGLGCVMCATAEHTTVDPQRARGCGTAGTWPTGDRSKGSALLLLFDLVDALTPLPPASPLTLAANLLTWMWLLRRGSS